MSDEQPPEQPPIESAVQQLANAATMPELLDAHREIRRRIRAARRKQSQQWGPLATAYGEMMAICDQMKTDGVSREDRAKGIEATLRQMWPFTREWKYLCNECNDTGLVMRICRDGARCDGTSTRADSSFQPAGKFQRLCTMQQSYEHEYGTPCFCSLGARFREKPKHDPADFSDAGRTSKPTRIGRR